jgi:hypothetical protein
MESVHIAYPEKANLPVKGERKAPGLHEEDCRTAEGSAGIIHDNFRPSFCLWDDSIGRLFLSLIYSGSSCSLGIREEGGMI